MIIIFLIELIFLLLFSYFVMRKDLFSPACIVCEGFIISTLFCMINWDEWGLASYRLESVALLSLGIISYITGCVLGDLIWKQRKGKKSFFTPSMKNSAVPINLSNSKIFICLLLGIVSCVLQYHAIRKNVTGSSLSDDLMKYNSLLTNNVLSVNDMGSFGVRQLIKLSFVIGLILIAILINNILVEGFKAKHIMIIIAIVPSVILTFISSTRIGLLKYVTFGLTVFNVSYHRLYGWKKTIRPKYIIEIICLIALVLAAFSGLRKVIGRGLRFSPLYYISIYAGGSIPSFDFQIQKGGRINDIWGRETFRSIIQLLKRFGIDTGTPAASEFYNYNGNFIGNVYTGICRYYNDFGVLGVIVLTFVAGYIITVWYNKCKQSSSKKLVDRNLIIFAMMTWGMYLISIDECMYSTVLSVLYITYIVLVYFAYWIMVDIEIKGAKLYLKNKLLKANCQFEECRYE